MATENILTTGQIANINKSVAEAFVEETDGTFSMNMGKFKKQIDFLISHMKMEETFHSTGKHKGWKLINYSKRSRAYMARGYMLIFNFRRYILDEEIDYRYYYTDNQGQAHVTTWKETDMTKYMKFTASAIQINPATAKMASIKNDYQEMLQECYGIYTSMPYMHPAYHDKTSSWLLASQAIREKYGGALFKKSGSPQAFTQGHIFEAIDGAIAEVLENNGNEAMIESYIFGRYLNYDNIKGSRGGDNPLTNTSIKANSADLYDFSTIKKQLELIQEVINGGIDKEKTLQLIKKEFMDEDRYGQLYEETAQKAYRKLENVFDKWQKAQQINFSVS